MIITKGNSSHIIVPGPYFFIFSVASVYVNVYERFDKNEILKKQNVTDGRTT